MCGFIPPTLRYRRYDLPDRLPDARTNWRSGYVRTAWGREGSLLVETLTGGQLRAVIVPAAVVAAVVADLTGDLMGREANAK